MPQHPEAVEFLTSAWGVKVPAGLYALLWIKTKKGSRTVALQHWKGLLGVLPAHTRDEVYVRASAVAKKPPSGQRGKATDAAAIPGLWLDVDVNGGPEDRTGYAPSIDAATELTLAIEHPTLIVLSGYGVQAWWLFDEPWVFANEAEREAAADMTVAWVEAHRQLARFRLDSVGDLARVMRLPGTCNNKGGTQVPVSLSQRRGQPFPLARLADHLAGLSTPARASPRARAAAAVAGELGDELPGPDEYPLGAVRAMREADEMFARTWMRKRRGWEGDDSRYDMAILSRLLSSGMAVRPAVAATIQSRIEYGGPEKPDKLARYDYWSGTVAKVQRGEGVDAGSERKREEETFVAELRAIREDSAPAVVQAEAPNRWAKLNKLVGGGEGGAPRVVEWQQHGTDPATAQHVWILSDGTEVPIGSMLKVLHQGSVKAALATVSNIMRPGAWKSATWELGIQTVLPLRVIHADEETERPNRALQWVARATDGRCETDAERLDEAIEEFHPFSRGGRRYVTISDLGEYLRSRHVELVRNSDLPPLLKAAGFERGTVMYQKSTGKRSSRSYWSIEEEHLP